MRNASLIWLASYALGVGAKQLWATEPAAADNIMMTAYPIGNGKLGGENFQLANISLVGMTLVVATPRYAYIDIKISTIR
jgi:hypothetical protein